MGDMGDMFNALREERKIKRNSNRNFSTQYLDDLKIPFESKNGGIHLIVTVGTVVIDFWPSTGLWMERGINKKQRGVRYLIKRYYELRNNMKGK